MGKQRLFRILWVIVICGSIPGLMSPVQSAYSEDISDTISGEWKPQFAVKIMDGQRLKEELSNQILSVDIVNKTLSISGTDDEGEFPLDNKWHSVKGIKYRCFFSDDGKILFRKILDEKGSGQREIIEMFQVREAGTLLEIDRRVLKSSGFFSSAFGLGMPNEDYEIKILRTYVRTK